MSLYLKHRPVSFEQIKGNSDVITPLNGFLNDLNTCPHVFLFHGFPGCGKTTIGRILADKLGCIGSDFKEINSANFRGIDTVRDIINNSQYKPLEGSARGWLIDEVQKMTGDAQNAFLKILEDTPAHVYFILCTTEPQKLIEAIKSRCQVFQVKPLDEKQMFSLLRYVIKRENAIMPDQKVIDQIIQDSLGRPREALNTLEKVLAVSADIQLTVAEKSAGEQLQAIELCKALIKKAGWKEVSLIIQGLQDQEPETIRRIILGYCQAVLLKQSNDQAAIIIETLWEPLYNIGWPGLTFCCYSIIKN